MAERKDANARRTTPSAQRLPDAELDVLGCLWQRGQATACEIRGAIDAYRPMAYGSVVTLLKRLEAEGLVTKKKGDVGKAFVYKPSRRPEPTYRHILKNLLTRLFGGNGVALVASLFETHPPTAEDFEKPRELLDQRRERTESGGKSK